MSFAPTDASPSATRGHWLASRLAPRDAVLGVSVGALLLFGLGLRLLCANGPLWNDEIWSLRNLLPIKHFWLVLWGISHDNNHFLNSLWLFFAAPFSEDTTWLRLPSIAAGTLSIPAMAYLGARRSRATAIAAAALTAGSFFQLTYSVEARGYATATLALIVAFAALEGAIDRPRGRARWVLAAAAGFAFFSHLAMGPAIALLGAIAFGEAWRRRGGFLASLAESLRMFWPTAVVMIPTLGFVVAGYLHQGGFTIGFFMPYAAPHAIGAMANMEMNTFGLDTDFRPMAAFALLGLPCLVLGAIVFAALPERRIAYAGYLVAIPVAVLTLHPPNTHVARYFFAASPFLLLLAAEAFGVLWDLGGWRRAAALAALAATLAGDGFAIARMQQGKQAPWTEALATIANSGDVTLASSLDFNVGKSVDYFNLTRGTKLDLAPPEQVCARKPAWYIIRMLGNIRPDAEVELGATRCQLYYALNGVYDLNVPSQLPWALYRLTSR